jgi:hypothetical protein
MAVEVQQNCLNMYSATNVVAVVMRFVAFLQLLGPTAMVFALLRNQIVLMITGKQQIASVFVTICLNFLILLIPVILALTYPHVGAIAGITGAIGTLFTVILIPSFTYSKKCYDEIGTVEDKDKYLPLNLHQDDAEDKYKTLSDVKGQKRKFYIIFALSICIACYGFW